jgi:DNA-binding response OmpR family regulator
MRVLIVEDEPKTIAYLKKGLSEEGYVVDYAKDGSSWTLSCRVHRPMVRVVRIEFEPVVTLTGSLQLRQEGIETGRFVRTNRPIGCR